MKEKNQYAQQESHSEYTEDELEAIARIEQGERTLKSPLHRIRRALGSRAAKKEFHQITAGETVLMFAAPP